MVFAAVALFVLSNWKRVPFEIRWKRPEGEQAIGFIIMNFVLRRDFQKALETVNNMNNPTPAQLRAFADNLTKRLQDDGHAVTAKKVEVDLPDNADADSVERRRRDLRDELVQLLLWDSYE